MEQKSSLIPLCRVYQNVSQRTGKPYLVGSLSYTTKIVGFQEETADGQTVWQLYIQERPPVERVGRKGRDIPAPTGEKPRRLAEQPGAGDFGGVAGGDYPIRSRSRQQDGSEELPF